MQSQHQQQKYAVIYGGTGFVGSAIAEAFFRNGIEVCCVSRSGGLPQQLQQARSPWAAKVEWLQGDVANPDPQLLTKADIVVTCVGSPPIPTFSTKAFDAQYAANGGDNIALLQACSEQKVKQIIIISATLPALLKTERFAYYKGKRDLVSTAEELFSHGDTKVSILFPSVIFGKRYTKSGRAIPLGFLKYVSSSLQFFYRKASLKLLKPVSSKAPVSVESIAELCVNEVIAGNTSESIHYIDNQKILDDVVSRP